MSQARLTERKAENKIERLKSLEIGIDFIHITELCKQVEKLNWGVMKSQVTFLKMVDSSKGGTQDGIEYKLTFQPMKNITQELPTFVIEVAIVSDGIVFLDCSISLKKYKGHQPLTEFLGFNCCFDDIVKGVVCCIVQIDSLKKFTDLSKSVDVVFSSTILEVSSPCNPQ